MQKFFCDLCETEIPAHNVRRDREYMLTKEGGHTVIVLMKLKQGDVCEACAKKVIAEGRESVSGRS